MKPSPASDAGAGAGVGAAARNPPALASLTALLSANYWSSTTTSVVYTFCPSLFV